VNKSIIPTVIVALIIGLAFGSLAFPRTSTQTTTQATTETLVTTVTTTGSNSAYPLVTVTRVGVLFYAVVATCTTVSGTRSIVYVTEGATTGVTTIYPPNLPQQYSVKVVTATTVGAGFQTYVQQPDTC
jgi:hypothetical protein